VAATAASIFVAFALRMLYVFRNSRAIRDGEPAMSRLEKKSVDARDGVEFGDKGFRYKY
jgi:hypothetical protein